MQEWLDKIWKFGYDYRLDIYYEPGIASSVIKVRKRYVLDGFNICFGWSKMFNGEDPESVVQEAINWIESRK
jgi:hypothetical protein